MNLIENNVNWLVWIKKNKYEMRIVVEVKSKNVFGFFLCNESRYGRKGNYN